MTKPYQSFESQLPKPSSELLSAHNLNNLSKQLAPAEKPDLTPLGKALGDVRSMTDHEVIKIMSPSPKPPRFEM